MRQQVWIGVALVVAALVAAVAFHRARDAAPPHDRYRRGECGGCHDEAPRHHLEPRFEVRHGLSEPALAARCGTCHEPTACVACHDRLPATHTSDFIRPTSPTDGAAAHVVVGRARPSACVVCHATPATECAGCHRAEETRAWLDAADEDLARWRDQLEARPH